MATELRPRLYFGEIKEEQYPYCITTTEDGVVFQDADETKDIQEFMFIPVLIEDIPAIIEFLKTKLNGKN